ncbi:peptidase [Streptomyces katsurahamanus]|uniref:Peptidase n=1 Tax=Streptomyces katsurahamanus TaxID=2577098 RepID=A0ABW9NRL7_9ACTN|nr:peptidase [Streptomyces katsurahamanus]
MLPPCCDEPAPGVPRPVHDVPVVTQYASPELVFAIAYEGHDPGADPGWAVSGAASQEEYRTWSRHLCGMACLRMALLHRDGHAPTLFDLLAGARQYGGYIVEEDRTIKGLIYGPFAHYAQGVHGLAATVRPQLKMDELTGLLDGGRLVMASVAKGIRVPHEDPPRRGGHLVLVRGRTPEGDLVFNNPSGHTQVAREATLSADRFADFFAGRGIALDLRPRTPSSAADRTAPASR